MKIFNRNNIPSIIQDIVQDGRDQVEIHKEKLRENPDRIILGREAETEKYASNLKSKYYRHSFLVGDSGTGKDMVLQSFAQRVAMAQLWEDDAFRDIVMRDYPEAVPQYEEADRMMNTDALRYKRVFIVDNIALQASSYMLKRGEAAELLKKINKASHKGNTLFVFNEAVDMLKSNSESFVNYLKRMLEYKDAHYGMIDTSQRLITMANDLRLTDFFRRIHIIKVNTHDPKTILRIMNGRYVLGNLEDVYKVRILGEAVEAATRLGIHVYGRATGFRPAFPMYAAYSTLEGAIVFVRGKGNREVTEDGVYDYLETKRGLKLDQPDQVGRDTMKLSAKHFISKEMRTLEDQITTEIRRANLSPSDIKALNSTGAVVNLGETSHASSTGLKGSNDKDVKREWLENRMRVQRGAWRRIIEFIHRRRK